MGIYCYYMGVIAFMRSKVYESPAPHFRAARIETALQEKVLGTRSAADMYSRFAFFLDSGHALAQGPSGEIELSGPALHWGTLRAETRIRVDPGSLGYYLFLSERLLDDAIGIVAEATELRLFAEQTVVASFDRRDEIVSRLDMVFARVVHETLRPEFGTEIAVSAYVRLILVLLWRSTDREENAHDATGHGRRQINRFRNLVEAHFRARWSARDYAETLGMSYDRLHDLCVRSVGKPPGQLIRERGLHEARVLLQRTTLSAERIAAMLGFSSASQFNHFFKSMAKETPGGFRKRATDRSDREEDTLPSFSDWP